MNKLSARDEIAQAPQGYVATLEGAKSIRLKAKTMFMPSPLQVAAAISAIPEGATKPIRQICRELADGVGADITCPVAASRGWRLVAEAAEESRHDGTSSVTPWWRVTRDGKPARNLPGGPERHLELLQLEAKPRQS